MVWWEWLFFSFHTTEKHIKPYPENIISAKILVSVRLQLKIYIEMKCDKFRKTL